MRTSFKRLRPSGRLRNALKPLRFAYVSIWPQALSARFRPGAELVERRCNAHGQSRDSQFGQRQGRVLLEKQVDRLGTEILIRYQPMITDLRTVLATIKLSSILERASNHAVMIARRSRKMAEDSFPVEEQESLLTHFDAVLRLFGEAIVAFREIDAVSAGRVLGQTESVAAAGRGFVEKFTELLEERPFGSRIYVNLMALAQSLEEITYLAEHIANEVVYIAEARDIRHPRNTLAETEETSP